MWRRPLYSFKTYRVHAEELKIVFVCPISGCFTIVALVI
jgi:hypothetical protein